jgi:hypothetical protein
MWWTGKAAAETLELLSPLSAVLLYLAKLAADGTAGAGGSPWTALEPDGQEGRSHPEEAAS